MQGRDESVGYKSYVHLKASRLRSFGIGSQRDSWLSVKGQKPSDLTCTSCHFHVVSLFFPSSLAQNKVTSARPLPPWWPQSFRGRLRGRGLLARLWGAGLRPRVALGLGTGGSGARSIQKLQPASAPAPFPATDPHPLP